MKKSLKILIQALVLHAEHSFNASTFAARVVASTRAHMYAAVSAAVGSLSGELHGGANMQTMRNLVEIGDPANVEAWVKSKFDHHERVMGMGHAVYKALDPRADLLRHISEKLARDTGDQNGTLSQKRLRMSRHANIGNAKAAKSTRTLTSTAPPFTT